MCKTNISCIPYNRHTQLGDVEENYMYISSNHRSMFFSYACTRLSNEQKRKTRTEQQEIYITRTNFINKNIHLLKRLKRINESMLEWQVILQHAEHATKPTI